jgi:hypothetical protein
MLDAFKVKPVLNKSNGQINFSLPKKKIPKDLLLDLEKPCELKIKIEELLLK